MRSNHKYNTTLNTAIILIILSLMMITSVIASPIILQVKYKNIVVDGKNKKVATIEQANGTWGYYAKTESMFDVIVKNDLTEPTSIHWHGLLLPNNQDGVAGLTQAAIAPGKEYHYRFPLKQTGTYWMHSHVGLQEQDYVEAPLIIESTEDKNYQQIVVMLQDFSFKPSEQILQNLLPATTKYTPHIMSMPITKRTSSIATKSTNLTTMDMPKHSQMNIHNNKSNMDHSAMSMDLNDLNDIKYDAYLTNYHDTSSPLITKVKAGAKIKLRFINGASASNFWLNLGKLSGKLVAMDGQDIKPVTGRIFQIAMGQRLDIIITVPSIGGTFPVIAQVEGLRNQTGIILTTLDKPKISSINALAYKSAPALNYQQELLLHSLNKEQKISDNPIKLNLDLNGNMQQYIWQINGQTWPNITPITVKQGQHIIMLLHNKTMMSHPIHLHGYDFKLININGKPVDGAFHDTILVLPHSTIMIEFAATYMGKWLLHCHMLYHMLTGMMTYLDVENKVSK